VEHNKIISTELRISYKVLKYSHQIFIYYPKGALLKYQNFNYKLQKSTLITFTKEKNRQISGT